MSVPTWRRNKSDALFLYELFRLNIRCAQIVNNKPKKYKQNYGDFLIKECLEALSLAEQANKIQLNKSTPSYVLEERELYFYRCLGILDNISTTSYIFLELVRTVDGYEADKICKEEAYFGETCSRIQKLISGVIKHDKRYIG